MPEFPFASIVILVSVVVTVPLILWWGLERN